MQVKWWRRDEGYTLLEVLVGLAVLLLLLGVVGNMEITAYKSTRAYGQINEQMTKSSPAVDWIIQDVRRAADVTAATGSTLNLSMPNGDTISYMLGTGASGGQVIRTFTPKGGLGTPDKVGSNITSLTFSMDSSATVTVRMQVSLTDGGNYEITASAIPRAKAKPAS